ncbi:proliferation-associated protein 2g4 [Phtheirospermum japonicum]|uniref:Proliferation-associated protein 2g4 n=1 Tax=Phtheirospermum japonicum TaxID=374723 RepID=A0A830BIE6_9LAMI|nr:proliferation-associated protein 2g4 [Phtheirospermum japonicum]
MAEKVATFVNRGTSPNRQQAAILRCRHEACMPYLGLISVVILIILLSQNKKLPENVDQNKDVTEAIQKVVAAYDCKIVEGVLSHQMKQFVINGNKVVLSVPVLKQKLMKQNLRRMRFTPSTLLQGSSREALGLVECVNHELLQPYPEQATKEAAALAAKKDHEAAFANCSGMLKMHRGLLQQLLKLLQSQRR